MIIEILAGLLILGGIIVTVYEIIKFIMKGIEAIKNIRISKK